MSDGSGNWGQDGVRLFLHDQLDPTLAAALSVHQVAALTHLPTGIDDASRSVLALPPGGASVSHPAGPGELLYWVIRGEARLRWGNSLQHAGTASVGSIVHVPPWVPLEEANSSASETLDRLLVRTD